jgi:DNA-directed RNA polymerase specialized sigma24 family protein
MFGLKKTRSQKPSPYATRADFCRIFQKDMDRLYLLSFLLTGDHSVAEQCFVGGLHMSQEGNPVFKEWAESWARRTIIRNAIRMIRPRPTEGSSTSPAGGRTTGDAVTEAAEIAAVVELPAFERFAFVMSVLERYSDQECSLLLNCTRGDVFAARTRALQQIGRAAELHLKLVSIASEEKALGDDSGSMPQTGTFLGLAASA